MEIGTTYTHQITGQVINDSTLSGGVTTVGGGLSADGFLVVL